MWSQVQKILNPAAKAAPPIVPLRKPSLPLSSLGVGANIVFATTCPLPQLAGKQAEIIAVRHYRFNTDQFKVYQLQLGTAKHFFLTIAEDSQGHYLSISRLLHELEQDAWFGRDALSFFTEKSSAKTIRCKADLGIEGDWAAARYNKTVDWMEGIIAQTEAGKAARAFHYNLLVNESGDKALEVEHDDENGENRVFITVYRPIDDLTSINPQEVQEESTVKEAPVAPAPKQRPDFRRRREEEGSPIHIPRTPVLESPAPQTEPELPAFLQTPPRNYLSLDEVIPPDSERIRVGVATAKVLIDRAHSHKVRVRDVLRELVGLDSALSDEVIFEMPLSEQDYRTLAMRYKIRPDHRLEIRARLQEEMQRLLMIK